jgi:hypothetical protein
MCAGGADARQVRRRLVAFALDLGDRFEGAFLGGAAGPEGDREELGLEHGQLWRTTLSLSAPSVGLGREEFDGDGAGVGHLLQILGK